MALLKKIKAASVLEIVIASAIILSLFFISSITINNIFGSVIKSNTMTYDNRLKEIHYLLHHKKIEVPFYENTANWEISASYDDQYIILEALHKKSNTTKTINFYNGN